MRKIALAYVSVMGIERSIVTVVVDESVGHRGMLTLSIIYG